MKCTFPDIVGGGVRRVLAHARRYRVVKGSRASKKSKTAALWYIYHLMRYPEANLLVVRRTYRTLERSAFAELKWAIARFGAQKLFEVKTAPLEITLKATRSEDFFRRVGRSAENHLHDRIARRALLDVDRGGV